MKKVVHQSNTRGHANHGWLDTYHTFSFANYYESTRIHFGNLRVLNDDIISANRGFGKHPHDNMEIISIIVNGELTHEDSMGHRQTIEEGEVQVMSAGTGIFHSEFNNSNGPTNLLQIWIFPKKKNINPVYNQHKFDQAKAQNQWQFLVNGENSPLEIQQDAKISRVFLEKGKYMNYQPLENAFGNYVFVVEGEVELADEQLNRRDGIGLYGCEEFKIKANENSFIINIEL